jgi:biotin synthase
MDNQVSEIIARAQEDVSPTYEEVLYLLNLDETSPEATAVRGAANDISRAKSGNAGVIWGQIGIDVYPCEADCQFCSFAKSTTCFTEHVTLELDDIVTRAKDFAKGGDLYGLWLMTMNTYDKDFYLDVVKNVRAAIPASTKLFSNIGDTDVEYFKQLKAAGLDGAYHVKRLGEGVLTKISPERREQTIHAAHEAGLFVQDCCEPIGAETTNEDIATRLFDIQKRGRELGLANGSGVMKRNSVPGTPYAGLENEITDLRLALIGAIQVFVMVDQEEFPQFAIHEPNTSSLLSGGNSICAESGFNPRDTATDTAGNHGLDVPAVRNMFYQAGFRWLLKGDGTRVKLTPEYMQAKLAE